MSGAANGGDVQGFYEAAFHQFDVDYVGRSHGNQMGDVGGAVGTFIGGDGNGCMLCDVAQPLVILLVDRLLHHEWADVAVVQGFETEQCLAGRVSLVGVERQAEAGSSFADGFDTRYIVSEVAAYFDLDAGYASRNDVFCQFVSMFGR